MAPMDQPARALDMVVRFVEGEEWGLEEEEAEDDAPAVVVAIE